MTKRAIIAVDIQNDYFPGGKFPLDGMDAAAANAARVIQAGRDRGDLIVHVRHEFTDPAAPFFHPGSDGAEINPAAAPQGDEAVVTKNSVNAFKDTDLNQILQDNGIAQVVIVGAMSHMCIDAATRAAADLGYATTVIHDACATRDLEFQGTTVPAAQVHAAMMSGLAFGYATVTDTGSFTAG
ncbi:MAG: cysteine hydrolase family protein [Paracoccus sp. (in: a-proteobacteria)]|uniref:cysteine hydrolase family protein n=1 Tax=Paracoccus sp. TaxID=267 RepID=UPI0026E10D30|nr:cysteine hydrolase family protein [Paracoccus sp. (in: a-proteobacteria)]MDO5612757.1 cysteine hydrolase family protein [Paracoccus sp. (in: a-proteobacteria)]